MRRFIGDALAEFASLAGGAKGAFVGELHAAVNRPWPDCNGRDTTVRTAAFERLCVLARKGYQLAMVRPEGGPAGGDAVDALKLVPDAIESIKQFTRGLFPNGVPPAARVITIGRA